MVDTHCQTSLAQRGDQAVIAEAEAKQTVLEGNWLSDGELIEYTKDLPLMPHREGLGRGRSDYSSLLWSFLCLFIC